mgnify:FL=1
MRKELQDDLNGKRSKLDISSSSNLEIIYRYIINKELGLTTDNKGKYLVLISGKGQPISIPNHSYFMSLSNLESILKNGSKYEVLQALNSVRQINKL